MSKQFFFALTVNVPNHAKILTFLKKEKQQKIFKDK